MATRVFTRSIEVCARRRGLREITGEVARLVAESGVESGLCNIFVRHTSASLVIQENADPTARQDLEAFLDRLVPEGSPWFQHTLEGPDDMPSHIKSALTAVSLSVPVVGGRLGLGTWQGIYLWEHREEAPGRTIIITVL